MLSPREAGVSPATLYHFFPNKEAIASALATNVRARNGRSGTGDRLRRRLSFAEAIQELLDVCMSFNRKHPEFHTLVIDAPLSAAAREEKQALGQVFVDFIAARLRREQPTLSRCRSGPPRSRRAYDLPRNP